MHVHDEPAEYGFVDMDRYQVGGSHEIDVRGGVVSAMMMGLATGEAQEEDPERWEEIPHQPVTGYSTDCNGTIPVR